MTAWTDWKDSDRIAESPYVDWGLTVKAFDSPTFAFSPQIAPQRFDRPDELQTLARNFRRIIQADTIDPAAVAEALSGPREVELEGQNGSVDMFPVLAQSNNPTFAEHWLTDPGPASWPPDINEPPEVGDDDVIAAVIDVDIGLGHRRFRDARGRTRVLAAWQQGATWDRRAAHLPFGQELSAGDIDRLLEQYSKKTLTGPLDQEGFDRAAGLVDLTRIDGNKDLAKRAAHGTHVMGLVGGADPETEPDFSERVRLLVVNLPPPIAYGEGGAFLDHYLIYALKWVIERHRQIEGSRQLPLIINISFGKQAGPKDDLQGFVHELITTSDTWQKTSRALKVVIPSGNDNLMRCNARFELPPDPDVVRELKWRTVPDDETSNFVEIWSEFLEWPGETPPFDVELVPPGMAHSGFTTARNRQITDLTLGLGRIYCDIVEAADGCSRSTRYQICLAPDLLSPKVGSGAPAGQWMIRFRNTGKIKITIRASIQTDQATLPGRHMSRRSYFEQEDYELFDWSGRLADTYLYKAGQMRPYDVDKKYGVRRHGTLNSYSANNVVATVGGFRVSDGRPAPYSASGLGKKTGPHSRGAPTLALPSDDGYAHFGILSDGARDGSVVAMRGTSFACACATRRIVEGWIGKQWTTKKETETAKWQLYKFARQQEKAAQGRYHVADIEKIGGGRVNFQPMRRGHLRRF